MNREIVLNRAMLKVGGVIRKIVLNQVMLKVGVILVGIILICSLIGIGAGGFIPTEKTKEVTVAKYSHQGEFSYKGYSASSLFSGETAQPNPVLFLQIIEEMEILFSYSGMEGVKMKVILEDKNKNWQKEIPIKTSGSSSVSFPLDWKEIILLGETINAELKGEELGVLKELSEEELKELVEEELKELVEEKLKELVKQKALLEEKLKELVTLRELTKGELKDERLIALFEAKLKELSEQKALLEEKLKEIRELTEEKLKEEKLKVLREAKLKEIKELKEKLLKKGSGFLLRIIAEAGTGKDLFAMTLEGDLSSSALKWKEEGFNKIERGFPGGDDWRQGSFGYSVKLKESELFEQTTLERKPELWKTSAVSPDFSLFTDLVESLDVGFNYQFNSDVQINSLEEETKVWMVMEEPGRWKKSFTLLAPTKKQGEFSLNFPLDIDKLRGMINSIDEEIGSKGAKEQEITIFTQVHTIAKTDSGIIDEVFDHQLKGKIGEKIEWGEEKDLTLTKEGTITKKIVEPNPLPPKLRKSSLIGFGVSFPIFCALAFLYWRRREKPSFLEEELKRNRKKYKELISEVTDFPPTKEGEAIINASSLEALVNISNNSLKPILLRVEPEKHIYWVVDGLIRYCYVVKEG